MVPLHTLGQLFCDFLQPHGDASVDARESRSSRPCRAVSRTASGEHRLRNRRAPKSQDCQDQLSGAEASERSLKNVEREWFSASRQKVGRRETILLESTRNEPTVGRPASSLFPKCVAPSNPAVARYQVSYTGHCDGAPRIESRGWFCIIQGSARLLKVCALICSWRRLPPSSRIVLWLMIRIGLKIDR